jgi:hypothetical protein
MEESDQRIAWLRDKVCTALGANEELFSKIGGAKGSAENTIQDIKALLDSDSTGGCILY